MLNKQSEKPINFFNNFKTSKNVHFHRFHAYLSPKASENKADLLQKLTTLFQEPPLHPQKITSPKQFSLNHDNYFSFRSGKDYNPYEDSQSTKKRDSSVYQECEKEPVKRLHTSYCQMAIKSRERKIDEIDKIRTEVSEKKGKRGKISLSLKNVKSERKEESVEKQRKEWVKIGPRKKKTGKTVEKQ